MIQLTLIANAGILISTEDRRYLIDGLHHAVNFPFSTVPEEMIRDLGSGVLSHADYLIFTHDHPDHFSPELTQDYLQRNKVRRVCLPAAQYAAQDCLRTVIQQEGVPNWELGMQPGVLHSYALERGIFLTALGTTHMGIPGWRDCRCDAVVLTVEGKNILFLSDCGYTDASIYEKFKDVSIDAALVNPFFFHVPEGRKILEEIIQPQMLILYHISFAGEDKSGMRGLASQDIRKFAGNFCEVTALSEPQQTILIGV